MKTERSSPGQYGETIDAKGGGNLQSHLLQKEWRGAKKKEGKKTGSSRAQEVSEEERKPRNVERMQKK